MLRRRCTLSVRWGVPALVHRSRRLEVEVVTGLDELGRPWGKLASTNETPMQTFAWTAASEAVDGERYPLVSFVLGGRDDPRAIAALRCVSRRPTELVLTAHGEPLDFLYKDKVSLAALCDNLVRFRVPLKLMRVFSSSPTVDRLSQAYAGNGLFVRPAGSCPAIKLDDFWLEPEKRFNSGRRSDIRRARRRAVALGSVTFELLTPRPGQVSELLDAAFAVEAAGWKGKAGTALVADRRQGEFFRRWAPLAAKDRSLRMAFMRVDGRPIAMHIAAELGNRLWLLKIGYDEQAAHCSPGHLLMLEVVKSAAERGLAYVEFLGGSEPWTELWATEQRPCTRIAAFPFTPGSALILVKDAVKFTSRGWATLASRN